MKKFILFLGLSFSFLNAEIPNRNVYTTECRYSNPQSCSFEVKDKKLGIGYISVNCLGGVVYHSFYRGGAISHNPITNRPYYCKIRSIEVEETFLNRPDPKYSLEIFYEFDNLKKEL